MSVGNRRVVLIGGRCIEHDNAAAVAGLFDQIHDRPRRRDSVTCAHGREKPRPMLQIRDRRPVEIHADRGTHDRRRHHAVQDRRSEARPLRILGVRVMRVEISDALTTDRVINELMGKDASARFRFIMERAEEANELDV